MILCASPDPKELHKTVSTLEYGAKAKCIIRAAHSATPRDKMNSEDSSTTLNSRIVAMNQFIHKLQKENKQREKERNEAQNLLRLKDEELAQLRAKIKLIDAQGTAAKEEEINSKVMEKTQTLRSEFKKMEEIMTRQQQELALLKQRLQEVEREKDAGQPVQQDLIGGRLFARLSEMPSGLDQSMSLVMSMDLDTGDQPAMQDVKVIKEDTPQQGQVCYHTTTQSCTGAVGQEDDIRLSGYPEKVILSTVFEEGDEENDGEKDNNGLEEEVRKEVVEETFKVDMAQHALAEPDDPETRQHRIQNIFRLCGNYRELAKKPNVQSPAKQAFGDENRSPATQVFGDEKKETAKQAFGDENKELPAWGAVETPMCDVKVTDSPVSSVPVRAMDHMPFSSLDNKLNSVPNAGVLSPKVVNQMSPNYIREMRA
jgi:kinesin family member 11